MDPEDHNEGHYVKLEVSFEVLKSYAFYVTLLIFKMVALSVFEIGEDIIMVALKLRQRKRYKTGRSQRDYVTARQKILTGAHMDDLETILPFFTLGMLFTLTHPVPASAKGLFQAFTAARFIHSVACIVEAVRQPIRATAWAVSTVINLYMAFKILFYFL